MPVQKETRRTGGGFSRRERRRRRGRGRESQAPRTGIFPYGSICTRTIVLRLRRATEVALRQTRPRDRPLLRYRHATHYAHRPSTYDFCEVRKENRAARVACNQSHVVRSRCIVLRSAARGYAPSIVNIARGHSCDDVHSTKTRLLVHFSPLTPCIVKENSSLLYRRGLRRSTAG